MVRPDRTRELRLEIEDRIGRFVDSGATMPVPGLSVVRLDRPLPPTSREYEPTLCVCVRGKKRVRVGEQTLALDRAHFFLASMCVPVIVAIDQASPRNPYVALEWRIDLDAARLLIADLEGSRTPLPAPDACIVTGTLGPELLDPLSRLLALVDAPQDVPVLRGLLEREILYRLLVGPKGTRLRELARLDSASNQVARAIRWLRDDYAKRLRLHAARLLMLREKLDAAVAAQRVGYESAAHFNHDYRRLFGRPPRRDVRSIEGEMRT